MKHNLKIVKIGGNVIDDEQTLLAFLKMFASANGPKILVHGGGKSATQLSNSLGIKVKMVEGRRLTDKDTLDLITMVYAGKINKDIVAQLQAHDCNALGLSGADANCIASSKREVKELDYGYVGDIISINTINITRLIDNGFIPVFCAITHDEKGQLLNTNADTIAAQLAIGLSAVYNVSLFYCFEKMGVLSDINDENSVIKEINMELYKKLKSDGCIAEGMIPKLDNCFNAITKGVSNVSIGNYNMINDDEKSYTTLKA